MTSAMIEDHVIALRCNRIALEALHQIALLQDTCPLAAETAVAGIREMKQVMVPETDNLDACLTYEEWAAVQRSAYEERHVRRSWRPDGQTVRMASYRGEIDSLDRALGEGRR